MKRLLLLLIILPALASAQLQNLPAGFVLKTYPGNPLVIQFTVGGTDPMPAPITTTLRYGIGLRPLPPENQPALAVSGRTFTASWGTYSPAPGTQYLEVSLGGSVNITGTINSSYFNSSLTSPASFTINYSTTLPITINVATSGVSSAALNLALATKADTGAVYNRSAVGTLLAQRVAVAQYNTDMVSLIGSIGLKAGISDVYTKTVSDGKYKAISYVPAWSEVTGKPGFFSGSYLDLTNRPTIPTVPTVLSAFTNDPGYLTPLTGDSRYLASSYVPAWASITGKPAFFSGAYTDLTGKPFIPATATDVGAYTTSQTDNLLLLRLPVSRVANKAALLTSATGAAHWIETDLDSDFGTPSVSLWDGTKLLTFPTLTR